MNGLIHIGLILDNLFDTMIKPEELNKNNIDVEYEKSMKYMDILEKDQFVLNRKRNKKLIK